jgi:hypothetical protein
VVVQVKLAQQLAMKSAAQQTETQDADVTHGMRTQLKRFCKGCIDKIEWMGSRNGSADSSSSWTRTRTVTL